MAWWLRHRSALGEHRRMHALYRGFLQLCNVKPTHAIATRPARTTIVVVITLLLQYNNTNQHLVPLDIVQQHWYGVWRKVVGKRENKSDLRPRVRTERARK